MIISSQGVGQSRTVQLTHKSMFSVKSDAGHPKEEMLRQVPECLWLQHTTDIGLMK